jgi:hypothetical protein
MFTRIGAEFLFVPLLQHVRIERHGPAKMLDVLPVAPQIPFQLRQREVVRFGAQESQVPIRAWEHGN